MGYLGRRIGKSQNTGNPSSDGTGGGVLDVFTNGYFQRQGNISNIEQPSAGPFTITGGTVLTPGNGKKYHVFVSPGNLTLSAGPGCPGIVDMFIVAGGGGGGGPDNNYGGGAGGGAGGIVYSTSYQLYAPVASPRNIPVVVGYAGTGVNSNPNTNHAGMPGGPSFVDIQYGPPTVAIKFESVGGGGGGGAGPPPAGRPGGNAGGGTGGSSGGSLITPSNQPQYAAAPGITTVYGNTGHTPGGGGGGGGGSGVGSVGGSAASKGTNSGGDGGSGRAFPSYPGPLIGPAVPNPGSFVPVVGPTGLYGGGGGGSNYRVIYGSNGLAGPGGGGAGNAGAAVQTTGGGGGGGRGVQGDLEGSYTPAAAGGNGGQGIVIISYTIS